MVPRALNVTGLYTDAGKRTIAAEWLCRGSHPRSRIVSTVSHALLFPEPFYTIRSPVTLDIHIVCHTPSLLANGATPSANIEWKLDRPPIHCYTALGQTKEYVITNRNQSATNGQPRQRSQALVHLLERDVFFAQGLVLRK